MNALLALMLAAQLPSSAAIDPSLSADPADLIEFERVEDAAAFGWGALPGAVLETAADGRIGACALRAEPGPEPRQYMGIDLRHPLDLTGAGPDDRIVLFVEQNFGSGLVINLRTAQGHAYRFVDVKRGQWTRVEVDLDPANWHQDEATRFEAWPPVEYLHIYSKGFDAAGEYMLLDGFAAFVGGKPVLLRSGP